MKTGHSKTIRRIIFYDNETKFATADGEGRIKIWHNDDK